MGLEKRVQRKRELFEPEITISGGWKKLRSEIHNLYS
jgi:hypothetical protein